MTFKKFSKLYDHYKNNYDFQLKEVTYRDLSEKIQENEEWIPDKYS